MDSATKSGSGSFNVDLSRGFPEWLGNQNASLAVTTYQVGKFFMFGIDQENKFWIYNRNVGRCLGMAVDHTGFWLSADVQLTRYRNILRGNEKGAKGSDAFYAPRFSYFTGDLDTHDVGIGSDGQPIFVNTLFNCLARPSLTHSFEPVWKPSFISRLAAEDRCHLNGLAMRDGSPGFVTATSTSDTYDGWREDRDSGGVAIDVNSNEIVCAGLSMPHSPRWHDNKLWLHNSGTGEFGFVNMNRGEFEPVAFCPGYLRGLSFMNGFAIVGLSLPRGNKTFSGLKLDDALSQRKVSPICGLYVIDLRTGDIVHSVKISGVVTELYDVAVLPGIRQPSMISPTSEDAKRMISLP